LLDSLELQALQTLVVVEVALSMDSPLDYLADLVL
jgi:hypothetical protein